MPRRVCAECGGEEFDPISWDCVTCKRVPVEWDSPNGGDAPSEDTPGKDGSDPDDEQDDDEQGEGEGEDGEGEGEPPPPEEPPLIVLHPGETVELEDGTLAVVAVPLAKIPRPLGTSKEWILCVRLITGNGYWRIRSVSENERTDVTELEPGDFIFTGTKQEIVTEYPGEEKLGEILDGCEYTVVTLDGGEIRGLTVDDAQKVKKVEEE